MSRLSLHDKRGDAVERKLPLCRICCQLFCNDSADTTDKKLDRRIASFRPCGHVFHYACIMNRYQRMEDNCSCVTCFARMDDLPMILFMEWSKSVRPLDPSEIPEIEIVTASDDVSMKLRDELELMKLKLQGLESRKEHIIRSLNEVNEAMDLAKDRCNGLDEICEAFSDRLARSSESYGKEKKACDEFEAKIKRDLNSAAVGELSFSLETKSESEILDFINQKVSLSSDPDDLRVKIGSAYDSFRRKLKDALKNLDQLKTTVHSLKKEIMSREEELLVSQRIKLVAKKPVKPVAAKPLPVVDRKIVPSVPVRTHYVDDLACQRPKRGFSSLFG